MTKSEKLREIITKDVKSGFMYEVQVQLKTDKRYVRQMAAHPELMEEFVEMIVNDQLPFYETVSDAAADAAHTFFMSEAGSEWCMLSAKFVKDLNKLAPGWINRIVKRLAELN